MTVKRKLPAKFNHLLGENNPAKDDLVDLRRLGQTKLMSSKASPTGANGSPQMSLFSYVHLRAPLPHDINPEIFGNGTKPEAYFLMRRSKDGYVSSTGMFKASFPWATKAEEDLERKYVKSHFDASAEETAGNLWVHPDDALTLSTDYRCRIWIEALVDERKVNIDHRNKAVTPPPSYKAAADGTTDLLDPSSAKSQTSARSVSPTRKIAQPRKSRLVKATATAKEVITTEENPESEVAAANGEAVTTTTTSVIKTEEVLGEDAIKPIDSISNAPAKSDATEGEAKATVEVEQTTETHGDVVIESTHVKVELPADSENILVSESPEDMIAKAKEMVAEALKETSETVSNKKRKMGDEKEEGDEVPDIKSLEIDSPPRSKRARVINAITEEKFQKRALIGLGATVAIGGIASGLAFFSNIL